MEVVDDNAGMISNFEVLQLLKDVQSGEGGYRKPGKSQQHLATILYSTLKYLEKTPCKDQTTECINEFMQAVESFKLTKAEKLQLLNQRPCTAVEIQLIVEESEERLTEEQIEELLSVISKTLPGDPPQVEEEEPMEEGAPEPAPTSWYHRCDSA